jgi:hypothetical protein
VSLAWSHGVGGVGEIDVEALVPRALVYTAKGEVAMKKGNVPKTVWALKMFTSRE